MKRIFLYILTLSAILSLGACSGERVAASHDDHEHEQEHEHGETDEIELTEQQMETVGITLGTIEKRSMAEVVNATGELAVSSLSEGVISPVVGGIVTNVLIKEGDYVKAGQTVAYMRSTELAPLQQEYISAMAEENAARQEFERQTALSEHGAGVKKNLDQARSALKIAQAKTEGIVKRLQPYGIDPRTSGNFIEKFPVKSTVSGTVVKMMCSKGGYADMQSPIANVTDTSNIYCVLNIFEKDLPLIKVGQQADLRLINSPEDSFMGKVAEIYDTFDRETKTIPIKVTMSGARGRLIPGMSVSAVINTSNDSCEALPESAVVSSGDKYYVFVLEDTHQEDGVKKYCFVKKEVRVGVTELGYTQITPVDEIDSDAKVVVSNAFYLNSMTSDHGEHSH